MFLRHGSLEVAVYESPIHFFDEGVWNDIDNTLVELTDEFETLANKFKIKLPKKLDYNKQIKLSMDDYSIDWSVLNIDSSDIEYDDTEIIPNNIKELVNINQSVVYRNIQQNVDIEYILTGLEVKENIILNNYVQDFSMTFEYKVKDLDIIEDEEGNIMFVDENENVVFVFSELYMIDADHNLSYEVEYDLVQISRNKYQITIVPNDVWLQTAVYPVKVDPTIVLQDNLSYLRDKYTWSTTGENDTSNYIKTGNYGSYQYRSYLEFDLSIIPDDSVVTYSHFELDSYAGENNCDAVCQVNIREVKDYISFDNILGADDDNVDNSGDGTLDIEPKIIDYNFIHKDDVIQHYYFDITELISKWHSNGDSTRIFELRNKDESVVDYVWFDSTNYSSGVKPLIEIGYLDTAGIKDYWTYSQYSAGQAGTGFVSDYTGNLTFVRNDLDFSTERQSLNLSFSFDTTNKDVDLGYGLGWRTNYNIFITEIEENEEYMVTDNTGNEVHYYPTTCDSRIVDSYPIYNDCYVAEDGSGNIYIRATFNNDIYEYFDHHYVLTMDQISYNFGSDEYLDTINDRKTNQSIIISRVTADKNKILKVQDQVGNKIDFSYDNGLLEYTTLSPIPVRTRQRFRPDLKAQKCLFFMRKDNI